MNVPLKIKTVCLMSIANPCNVTIRITRSCDTVLWLIDQNRMKPQSPVEDLCIFFMWDKHACRLLDSFSLSQCVTSSHSHADGEASQIPKQTSGSVLRQLFESLPPNATQSWGLCSRPCIMHDMVHKQYAKIFPCCNGSSIIPRLPLNL